MCCTCKVAFLLITSMFVFSSFSGVAFTARALHDFKFCLNKPWMFSKASLLAKDKSIYYFIIHSKYFPFLIVKTTRIIHPNQLLLTKFGKNFVILNRRRQNDVTSAALLQVIEHLTVKTWRRGWVVLVVRTKWLNSRRNILLVIDMHLCQPRLACFSLFLNLELFRRNNKTIIEFGFRRIWRILQIKGGVIHLGLRAWWIAPSFICRILHILLSLILIIAK